MNEEEMVTKLEAITTAKEDLVSILNEKRKVINAEFELAMAKFEDENSLAITRIKEIDAETIDLKESITESAKTEFAVDGFKKRFGGIGIRVMNVVEYSDAHALTWAKKHELCLKLDASAFKKIAKTQDIDFVTKSEKVTVTFPAKINLEGK